MFNLIKAELFQIKIRKMPKIWLVLAIVFGFIMAIFPQLIMLLINNPVEGDNFSITAENPETALVGYTIASHIEIAVTIIFSLAVFILFLMAYTAFNDELKNRTVMNPIIVGHPRYQVYLAKYFSAIIMSFAFFVVLFLSFIGFNLLINGGSIVQYFELIFIENLLPIAPLWLMWLSFYMILLFISASDYIYVLYILAESIIGQLVRFIGTHVEIIGKIEPYLFYNILNKDNLTVNHFNLTPYVATVYTVLFLLIGINIFRRKEIK